MHVVSWETNKTRFSKYTSPQIGENQNCPTWVRSPLLIAAVIRNSLSALQQHQLSQQSASEHRPESTRRYWTLRFADCFVKD